MESILVERADSAAQVIFNRPEVRNAINAKMWGALPRLLAELGRDRAVRVVVFAGAGDKAFAAGADIGELRSFANAARARQYERLVQGALEAIVACPVPTIAMIQGFAMGGGCHVAVACDLRIAAEDAQLGIPAARIGAGINPRVAQRLVALVGPAVAKEMLFTGTPLDARRAFAVGLVNHVVPGGALERFTSDLARQIAENAPLTVRGVKRSVNWAALEAGRRPPRPIESLFVSCFASRDFREGIEAFIEKRPARFLGR